MKSRLAAAGLLLALATVPAGASGATKPRKIDGNAVISFKGVGPITLGMTIAQARKAAGHGIVGGSEVTPGCRQDTVLPKRFGLQTLRFNKKIRVLYVTRTAMPTAKGVRVNDSLARLQSKYGSKLIERPSDVSRYERLLSFVMRTVSTPPSVSE
ncbi:MAG: hypothetical protein ACJ79K_02180 [Gemmatimonadaceae bacterium]